MNLDPLTSPWEGRPRGDVGGVAVGDPWGNLGAGSLGVWWGARGEGWGEGWGVILT